MKLASLKSGRDGHLFVVSDDLAWCADAAHIAPTLQAALDDWDRLEPALRNLASDLAHEAIPMMRFHERDAAAPLPRAYQWADGSAYVNHVALVRQARNAEMPESFWHDPLMYQGGSDGFLGARDPIPLADENWERDFTALTQAGLDWQGEEVRAALARLAEEFRAAVLLVDVDGLPYEEAAAALECPVGTLRSRLSRARKMLFLELRDYALKHGFLRNENA